MNGAAGEQIWKSLVYNVDITPDQVKNFYKSWAGTYEDDMNKLNFTGRRPEERFQPKTSTAVYPDVSPEGAGLLTDMLTTALSRSGRKDTSKVGSPPSP
jgi:hypothetical protein